MDSKALVDSAEELEMPVIFSNHCSEEHSVQEVEEEATHSEVAVVELGMSVEMILKLRSLCHSWKLLPVHPGKSQSPPWLNVNHALDLVSNLERRKRLVRHVVELDNKLYNFKEW